MGLGLLMAKRQAFRVRAASGFSCSHARAHVRWRKLLGG
jgi:hypothetical protein